MLGTNGQLSGAIRDLPESGTAGHFVAGSSEHFVAVVMRHVGSPRTLKLHIYRAADLTHVDEIELASTSNECDLFGSQAVSLIEQGNGDLSVAVLRVHVPGSIDPSNGLCSFSTQGPSELLVLKRIASGAWAPIKKVANAGVAGAFGGLPSDLYRLPCREEWVLSFGSASGSIVKKVSIAGQELPQTVDTFTSTQTMTAAPSTLSCTKGATSVVMPVLILDAPQGGPVQGASTSAVRFWSINSASGLVNRNGEDLQIPTLLGATVFEGPNADLYLAGIDSTSKLRAFQLFADPHEAREVTLASEVPGSNPTLGVSAVLGAGSGTRMVGGAYAGESIVVGVSRGTPTTSLVAPGDPAPPVAATYTIGCPSH